MGTRRCIGYSAHLLILASILGYCLADRPLLADKAILKNGAEIEGTHAWIKSLDVSGRRSSGEIDTFPLLLMRTPGKRYFVHKRQVDDLILSALSAHEKFKLPNLKKRNSHKLQQVGIYKSIGHWNKFGRREVQLSGPANPTFFQGISELGPEYCKVTTKDVAWNFAIATSSIPLSDLDRILRHYTDKDDPNDRLAIARFYLQAKRYSQSQQELTAIAKKFPELKARVEEMANKLRLMLADRLLNEMEHRKDAGQHYLAYNAAKLFPKKGMSTNILRRVREFVDHYDDARERGAKVGSLLGELQCKLDGNAKVADLAHLRSEVTDLDYESLDRLDAFLKLQADDSLSASEKLAIAYSGWVIGSPNAISNLDLTRRLWQARFLVLQYLRSKDSDNRRGFLRQIAELEGIGPDQILQLIPFLPPIHEKNGINPGEVATIDIGEADAAVPVKYSVLLPIEYNPHHTYPMIVALRAGGRTGKKELEWWGGTKENPLQSQRRGYIVIAPEYANENQHKYDYGTKSHFVVIKSIRDARKRFSVDSDRIFLAGHGMGGDAAFDIGMSHPDLFAGVIPITGVIDKYCKFYWKNSRSLAWYIVAGELDRDTFDRNVFHLNQMLKNGFDVIYTEYTGRGFETYYAEIHKLFDWMDLQRRTRFFNSHNVAGAPLLESSTLRKSDNRFYWIKLEGMPKNVAEAALGGGSLKTNRPMPITAAVNVGNTIRVDAGADRITLWLSPDFVDFQKRVHVRINKRLRFSGFLESEIETILEDLRIRGDRQKLFTVKKVF